MRYRPSTLAALILLSGSLASLRSPAAPPDQKSARPIVVGVSSLSDKVAVAISASDHAIINVGTFIARGVEEKIVASPTFRLVDKTAPAIHLTISTNSSHSTQEGKNENTISYAVAWYFENPSEPSGGHFIGMEVDSFVLNSKVVGQEAKQVTNEIADKILAATDKRIPIKKQ